MQRAAIKVKTAIIILFMVLLFCGCGSEDVLDETNQRYKTDVSFSDAENEDILGVDVVYTNDCNGDLVPDDPETWTDLYANITITIDSATTPGLDMESYEVSFRPLRSYDTNGNAITPPSVGTYYGEYDVNIPTLFEVSFWITCMEMSLKDYIGSFITNLDWEFRYEVTIDMHFVDDYGENRDITVMRTLYFGWYDNC